MINNFRKISPLRILDQSVQKGLGPGNLGALMARAGVGKTACLIHIAFDRLFRKEKVVHISLEDVPEKISSYYQVIFHDLIKALHLRGEHEIRVLSERNRMIFSYLNQSFEIERLRRNLNNLRENIDFIPDTLIIDGLDFEHTERSVFEGLKSLAIEFQLEIWLSALSHRHITDVNERGIPYPCSKVDDILSIIIQLQPSQSDVSLRLLKDHDEDGVSHGTVRLDPNTFLALPE